VAKWASPPIKAKNTRAPVVDSLEIFGGRPARQCGQIPRNWDPNGKKRVPIVIAGVSFVVRHSVRISSKSPPPTSSTGTKGGWPFQ